MLFYVVADSDIGDIDVSECRIYRKRGMLVIVTSDDIDE